MSWKDPIEGVEERSGEGFNIIRELMYVNEVDVSGGQYAARGGKRLSAVLESLYDTLISIIDLRILASVRTVAREGMSCNQMTNGRTRCVVVIGRRRAGVTRRLS